MRDSFSFRRGTSHQKASIINSKWFKDLNISQDTIKLLEENTGKTLFSINCSKVILDQSPKAKEIKAKINKWNLNKFESFCTARKP